MSLMLGFHRKILVTGMAIVAIALLSLAPSRSWATEHHVPCAAGRQPCYNTITEALKEVENGDLVTVHAGAYNEKLDLPQRLFSLISTGGADATIINGGGDGRVINNAHAHHDSIIKGFTITGGRCGSGESGGGYSGGPINIIECRFINNKCPGGRGGGLHITGSGSNNTWALVKDSTITGNEAGVAGGGIAINEAVLIENCHITGNKVLTGGDGRGGGVSMSVGAIIHNSHITGNLVQANNAYGGGILAGIDLELHGGTVADNQAQGENNARGGGIYASGTNLGAFGVSVSGNQAVITGSGSPNTAVAGGIFCSSGTVMTFAPNVTGNSPDETYGCFECKDSEECTAAGKPNSETVSDPVNTYTGESIIAPPPDLYLGGPLPLYFSRYYTSRLQTDCGWKGCLGRHWSHNFRWRLLKLSEHIRVVDDRGRGYWFEPSGGGWKHIGRKTSHFQLVEGVGAASGREYTFGDPRSKQLYTFDDSGVLKKIGDTKGNALNLTHDVNGLLLSVADGLGRELTFTYDGKDRLTSVSDGTRTVVFELYPDHDKVKSITDARGNKAVSYGHWSSSTGLLRRIDHTRGGDTYKVSEFSHSQGRVTAQYDAYDNATRLTYDGDRRAIKDALDQTARHSYNPQGDLTLFEGTDGLAIAKSYDEDGRLSKLTDRLGDVTTYSYDEASGRPARITETDGTMTAMSYVARTVGGITFHYLGEVRCADGTAKKLSYDGVGNPTMLEDQAGSVWRYTYNDRGQVLTATNPLGGVKSYSYNEDGTRAWKLDPGGNRTTYDYDSLRRLTRVTRPDLTTRVYSFDENNNLLSRTDEEGRMVTFSYDETNNLVQAADPLGRASLLGYDLMDRVTTATDRRGKSASWSYDKLGRKATFTDRAGMVTSYGYDMRGRLTAVTDGAGQVWKRSYDAESVLASRTDPLGNRWIHTSDKMGRLTGGTSPLGFTTRIRYDALGRVTATENPLGERADLSYDARGRVSGMALMAGAIAVSYTRNALGLITEVRDPNNKAWGRGYDTAGRLISRTDPLGNQRIYSYDTRNRVRRIDLPGAGSPSLELTYDGRGRVTRRHYSDGTDLAYTYDTLGRLTATAGVSLSHDENGLIVTSNGLKMTRQALGRIKTLELAPGKVVTYSYNSRSLLSRIEDWLGGITAYTYDEAGRLVEMSRPNGIVTTYSHDEDSRLVGINHGAQYSILLGRDAAGRITAAERTVPQPADPGPGGAMLLEYDAASQVSSHTYDALGRLTGDGTRTCQWNLASRLKKLTESGATTQYAYDGLGLRLGRTTGGVTREYIWNYGLGLPSVNVVREGGNDLRYYITTPGGALLYSVEASDGSRRFYHYDEMGNTLYLSRDDGSEAARYAYGPYGALLGESGQADNPFTWQGRYGVMREGGAGLYYVRARYYDSSAARFLSRDPVKSHTPLGINPYQYGVRNPLFYNDPLGEEPIIEVEGFGTPWVARGNQGYYGTFLYFQHMDAPDSRFYYDPEGSIPNSMFVPLKKGDRSPEGVDKYNKWLARQAFETGIWLSQIFETDELDLRNIYMNRIQYDEAIYWDKKDEEARKRRDPVMVEFLKRSESIRQLRIRQLREAPRVKGSLPGMDMRIRPPGGGYSYPEEEVIDDVTEDLEGIVVLG